MTSNYPTTRIAIHAPLSFVNLYKGIIQDLLSCKESVEVWDLIPSSDSINTPTILFVLIPLAKPIKKQLLGLSDNVAIIIVGENETYASEAWKLNAVGFVLKNQLESSLLKIYKKAKRALKMRQALQHSELMENKATLKLPVGKGENVIFFKDDILYFKSKQDYSLCVINIDNKLVELLINARLGKLEKLIKDRSFLRIHRQYVVNTAKISKIKVDQIKLSDGTFLPVSRGRRKMLNDFFQN